MVARSPLVWLGRGPPLIGGKIVTRTIFAAAVLLAVVCGQAQAACKQSDLLDRWSAYAVGQSPAELFVQECTIHITSTGEFRYGSKCTDGSILTSTGMLVRNNCRVSGTFTQTLDGEDVSCEISGMVSASKEVISGVSECDEGTFFLFSMIRR